MKIRFDFVTNSSSSCYICDICGDPEEYDWWQPVTNNGVLKCENGHHICLYCIPSKVRKKIDDGDTSIYKKKDEYIIKSDYCPVCSMVKISFIDRYKMLCIMAGKKDIDKYIKKLFKSYNDFKKYIESNSDAWRVINENKV